MGIKMIIPPQGAIDSAKERGVNLLLELTNLVKYAVESELKGESVEYIGIQFTNEESEKLSKFGINLAESTASAYRDEAQRHLDQKIVENTKKVVDLDELLLDNAIWDMYNPEYIDKLKDIVSGDKVVLGASLATILQDMNGFVVAPMNIGAPPTAMYHIGKYNDTEIWVDPMMAWSDHKIYFI